MGVLLLCQGVHEVMPNTDIHRETGFISVVQEYRFNFITDDGRGLLLTLDRFAGPDLDQLCQWQAEKTHVNVSYHGEPDLISGVAFKIEPFIISSDDGENLA